jgi:hypothetical protein
VKLGGIELFVFGVILRVYGRSMVLRIYRRRHSFQLGVNFEVTRYIVDLEVQLLFWGILIGFRSW